MSNDILEPNPFAKPILAPQGDLVARDTFASVGAALSAWEHCETAFGTIYAAFVKPTGGTHLVLRAYGTILAAGTRREMIAAAAETYFAIFQIDSLSSTLRSLLKLYKDGASRRNEIAHGVVMSEPVASSKAPVYFLVPSFFASRKHKLFHQGPKYRLSTHEIDHYTECYGEMATRAMKFQQSVRAIYSSLPEKLLKRYP